MQTNKNNLKNDIPYKIFFCIALIVGWEIGKYVFSGLLW